MGYIAQEKDYWIHSSALNISLNALGNPNRTLGSVSSGAVIMCFIEHADDADSLGYNAAHGYKSWPLQVAPTYFNSNTEKYVYVAIPRASSGNSEALVVFPSEELDIDGKNADGAQVGAADYLYIYIGGKISATDGNSDRQWVTTFKTGKLDTAEGDEERRNKTEWYEWSQVMQVVTFLKRISMATTSWFENLRLGSSERNLTGVAVSTDEYTDSDTLVATPGYVEKFFLSKAHDDATPYSLGVGGNLSVDGDETVGGNLSVGNILRAVTGYITSLYSNLVQSTNYTGDGIADTGYRLTANHNGHSKLTIDEIYVRMKAVFESLEVRERTYAGGDQIWSCAGNRINRVDYLGNVETSDHAPEMIDVHADGRPAGTGEGDVYSVPVPGDTYGYSYVKVPWLLRQMPFLLRHKFFGRLRRVRIILNEQEDVSGRRAGGADSQIGKIRRARCYFLAKDDDMEVHNWWRINDLARCQTMNLANTTRKTYLSGEDQKAGNIFWWRKVIGVSYEPVKLDDGKEYHYFDVAFDYLLEQEHPEEMATSVMEGSDIPAASDSVVQFGNTIIEGRMNLMMMEVNGGDAVGYTPSTDAPCLKAYRGVYCFDLNKCWVGGNPRKMMLSPKSGYEFYGPHFKQRTEYDVVPVPVERGLWLDIVPTRDDYREHAMVRKCYYYDKVSHSGSYWLCSIVDGAHWVDGNGDYISDATYSALTEAQKAMCSRKQNYTIEEPSANSIDWTEVVKRGDKGTSIKSVTSYYAKTNRALVMPRDDQEVTWEESLSALGEITEGWYVWTKNITTYSDTLENTTTYTVSKWGIDGDGIENIETKFYEDSRLLTQQQLAALTEDKWKEYNQLSLTQGEYIYTRTKITYDKGDTPTISYQVNRIGQDGVSYITTEEYYCLGNSNTTPPTGHPYTRNDGKPQSIPASSLVISGDWSESRPTYDTSTAAGRAKKYLWNFEVSYDTTTDVQVTQPLCIANYEKGIQSIIETYTISVHDVKAAMLADTAERTAHPWVDEAHDSAPTDELPYQWNKTVTTYSDGSSDTFYHVSAVKGTPGSNGDTPIQAFQWNQSATVAPSPLPSGGTLGNWSATAPNRPTGTGDYYLWMTQTVKHVSVDGTVTYDTWSPAVRISGDKGDAGEDASDQEFVYIRLNVYPFPNNVTKPADATRGKVHGTGDWVPASQQYETDDWVPDGWSDTAISVAEDNKYVYAAIRVKSSGHDEDWDDFGEPFLWGNWGVQGIDGDGVQYVYKLFDHELTDAERTSNIPTKPASQTQGEWIPTGWSDDPLAPTISMQYCYCSTIKKIGGEWADTFDKLGLWSRYSKDGDNGSTPIQLFKWSHTPLTASDKPNVDETDWATQDPYSGWYKAAQNRPSGDGYVLYMSQNTLTGTGTIEANAWTTPIQISGTDGTPGEDGKEREWIYRLDSNAGYSSTTGTIGGDSSKPISGQTGGVDNCRLVDDFVPTGWSDNPNGISKDHPTEYASFRVYDHENDRWGAYQTPIVWSHWGRNGMDGDGTEYVFIRTKEFVEPIIADEGTSYLADEWKPLISNGAACDAEKHNNEYRTTDDPTGTDDTYKYEWVAKRTMSAADATTGQRTWKSYRECIGSPYKMSLWSNYAESNLIIDIDNEADQFGTDSDSIVIDEQVRTTNVSLYYGTQKKAITSLSAVLYYEDGTEIDDDSIAYIDYSLELFEGSVTVTVCSDADFSGYGGIYAEIEASCDLGSSKKARFTIQKVMSGEPGVSPAIYQLKPSMSTIPFSRDASNNPTPPSRTVNLTILRSQGNQNTEYNSASAAGVVVRYSTSSMPTSASAGTSWTSGDITVQNSASNLYIAMFRSNVCVDKETIPVIKDGANGNKGTDAQYIYLKGTAQSNELDGSTFEDCVVSVNGGSNISTIGRGLNLVTLNRHTLATVDRITYDTFGEASGESGVYGITDLISKLNTLNNDVFVCLVSYDAIGWNDALIAKLQSFGMSDLPYTRAWRYPFLFIGYKGLGKGNGITRMNDIATPSIPVEMSVYVANGALSQHDGENAVSLKLSPENVIITQSTEEPYSLILNNAKTIAKMSSGSTEIESGITISSATPSKVNVGGSLRNSCTVSISGNEVAITGVGTDGDGHYFESGYVDISATYNGKTYTGRFNFYCNLLGTWKETVVGDTKTEVAKSLSYAYTEDGQGVQSLESLGSYIKSSTENISRLEKKSVSNNLILNGAFISSNLNWDNWGNPLTREIVRIGDKNWMHIVSTNAQFEGYQQRHYADYGITVEPGGQYTISLRAHTASGSGVVAIGFHWYNGSTIIPDGGDVLQSWYMFNIDASDKVYSQTFNVPSGANSFNIFVGDNTVNAQNFYMTEVKLEEGDVATVWTENVQDTYSEIKQTADEISLTVHGEMAGGNINLLYGVDDYTESNKLVHKHSGTDGVIEYEGNGTPHIFTPVQLIKGCTYTIQCVTDGNIASSHSSSGNPSERLCTIWLRMNDSLNGGYVGECFTYSYEGYQNLGGGRHKWTFVCQKTGEYWFRTNSYSDGTTEVTINFWNIKLEGGDTATDWTTSASQMTSEIKQTANEINLSIQQGLKLTGINIQYRIINLIADKTNFYGTNGKKMISFEMYKNVPSILFYDRNGRGDNQEDHLQWILNYHGFKQALETYKPMSWSEDFPYVDKGVYSDTEIVSMSGEDKIYAVNMALYEGIRGYMFEVFHSAKYIQDGVWKYVDGGDEYENRYWENTEMEDEMEIPSLMNNHNVSAGYYLVESDMEIDVDIITPAAVNEARNGDISFDDDYIDGGEVIDDGSQTAIETDEPYTNGDITPNGYEVVGDDTPTPAQLNTADKDWDIIYVDTQGYVNRRYRRAFTAHYEWSVEYGQRKIYERGCYIWLKERTIPAVKEITIQEIINAYNS